MRMTVALVALISFCFCFATAARGDAEITLTVDASSAGHAIAPDFCGLSFEMQDVLPGEDGKHLFSPDNQRLLATFRTLGVRNLRVGGNTSDRPSVPVPGEQDIDELFEFADAADVKVIYTLRARESNASDAARVARAVMQHKDRVCCLAIGNEPNVYIKSYEAYRDLVKQYIDAVTAPGVAPEATFCAPSTTPGRADWARNLANEFGGRGKLTLITQHAYPGGGGNRVTDTTKARNNMLSQHWHQMYQKTHDAFVPAVLKKHLKYRIEETNSYFNGGAKDVSDTFASALWGLDYLYWWAEHDASGLNFHTGDHVAAGERMTPCRYAAFWGSPEGYNVHPIGYAMKAFDLGSHGRLVPVKRDGKGDLNLDAYSVAGDDGKFYLTLINCEHGEAASAARITVHGAPGGKAEWMVLQSPGGDVAAKSGVTLGGSGIADDATWNGKWTSLDSSKAGDGLQLRLPAATAAIVRISPK